MTTPTTPNPQGDELVERLQLIAAWRKPGGPTPKEDRPAIYKACTEAAARITADRARIEVLEGALTQAAEWFDKYAASHQAQADTAPEGSHQHIVRHDKAARNRERAAYLRTALTSGRGEDRG
jgi:hypothetical protein